MRSYGARVDPDGTEHARVSQANDYSIEIALYRRDVAGGSITCRMLKADRPAKRIVQLVAVYMDAGVQTERIVQCENEDEEIRQLERLERIIREASRRPSTVQP
jgi:hypothetical protein